MKKQLAFLLLLCVSAIIFGASEKNDNVCRFRLTCALSSAAMAFSSKRIGVLWIFTDTSRAFVFKPLHSKTCKVKGSRKRLSKDSVPSSDFWLDKGYATYNQTGYPSITMSINASDGSVEYKCFALSNPENANWPDLDASRIHTTYDPNTDALHATIVWSDKTKQQLKATAYAYSS